MRGRTRWWSKGGGTTDESVGDRIERLRPYVGGFLATFVQNEGTGGGLDIDRARRLRRSTATWIWWWRAEPARRPRWRPSTRWASTSGRSRALRQDPDQTNIISAMLRSDRPDGLWPTVVCGPSGEARDSRTPANSLRRTLETGRVFYESRRRGLWEKGATSAAATTPVDRSRLRPGRDSLHGRSAGSRLLSRGPMDVLGRGSRSGGPRAAITTVGRSRRS